MLTSIFLSILASAAEARSISFQETSVALNGSLYQSVYENGYVYLTSAVGKVVNETYIFKVTADTLERVETKIPERDPAHGFWAGYGIGADPAHNHIFVTNTRQNTISAYSADDLSLVSHLEQNTTAHARDVLVNEQDGKAYVSSSTGTTIGVYDTSSLKFVDSIQLQTSEQPFQTVMELVLDAANQVLYTVSLKSNVAAAVELNNNNKITYYQLGNATQASAVAYDTKRSNLYVASQGSDEILIINTNAQASTTSKSIKLPSTLSKRAIHDDVDAEIQTANGNLFAAYEPTNDLVYVVNRLESDVYVIDAGSHEILTTLKTGKFPNHVAFGENGIAYVCDKGTPSRLHRFVPQVAGNSTGNATTSGANHGAGTKTASGSAASKTGQGVASATPSGTGAAAPTANGGAPLVATAGLLAIPALALLM